MTTTADRDVSNILGVTRGSSYREAPTTPVHASLDVPLKLRKALLATSSTMIIIIIIIMMMVIHNHSAVQVGQLVKLASTL